MLPGAFPHRSPRVLVLLSVAMVAAAGAAGCDGGDAAPRSTGERAVPATSGERDGDAARNPADEPAHLGDDEDTVRVPSRAASTLGRRLDVLVLAYRPVSLRLDYLVSAVRLREDAVEADASNDVVTERSGAVRVELRRFQRVLAGARTAVLRQPALAGSARSVQPLLRSGIAARERSLAQLEHALDLDADPDATDRQRAAADRAWRASWDESTRIAREATTLLQDIRGGLRLDPASENAIR